MLSKFYIFLEGNNGNILTTTDFYAREENEREIKTLASRRFSAIKKFNPELVSKCVLFSIYKQIFYKDGSHSETKILIKDCLKNRWQNL